MYTDAIIAKWSFKGTSRVYEKWEYWFPIGPAHMNWYDVTEQAIMTCKNNFLVGLSSVDDGFPMHLWDWLLYQADITLNIPQPKIINPMLSTYNMIWGTFDFNMTPMVPPGCKIIVLKKPGKCKSWVFHGVPRFNIWPFTIGYLT